MGSDDLVISSPQLTRMIVIGSSGAGKTVFSRQLAAILEIPHIELDAVHWQRDWTPRNKEQLRDMMEDLVSQECWIVDGNYSAVRDIVWPRATTAFWLNYPFITVFWRVFYRTVTRVVRQEELFSGNRESFRLAFLSRESPLWWVITTYSRRRREFRKLFAGGTYPKLELIEFRKPEHADKYLIDLKSS